MVNKELNEQVGVGYRMDGGDATLTKSELAEYGLKPEGFRGAVIKGGKTPDHVEQDVTAGPLNDVEDGSFAKAVLIGLQLRRNGSPDLESLKARRRHKPGRTNANDPFHPVVYMGTVDPVTVAERRAKNKAARKRRVANARRARR